LEESTKSPLSLRSTDLSSLNSDKKETLSDPFKYLPIVTGQLKLRDLFKTSILPETLIACQYPLSALSVSLKNAVLKSMFAMASSKEYLMPSLKLLIR